MEELLHIIAPYTAVAINRSIELIDLDCLPLSVTQYVPRHSLSSFPNLVLAQIMQTAEGTLQIRILKSVVRDTYC